MKLYVRQSGKIHGPFWDMDAIRSMADSGRFDASAEAIDAGDQSVHQLRDSREWTNLGDLLAGRAVVGTPLATAVGTMENRVVRRYQDGYRVASAIIGFAGVVKLVGALFAVVIALSGLMATAQVALVAIPTALAAGAFFWVCGVLVAAQGQIVLATLDTAISHSPFLTNQERALAMGLSLTVASSVQEAAADSPPVA